ncbi:MAG: hypothetical protein HYT28_01055 [Parcubacteria group bacterium]|nr:hypothetical protein [Parcubacteria group bacterium]
MPHKLNTIFFLLCSAVFLAMPALGFAALLPNGEPLLIIANPENPKPFDTVTARVESFRFDVSRSVITWYVNGKKTASGIGKTQISFSAGGGGKETTVEVVAQSETSGVFNQTLVFRPADVALLWEADTYTPPFYQGKALASSAARIKITAFPEFTDSSGRAVSPRNLVYQWQVDGSNLPNQSGYGARTITVTGARIYRDTEISVEVSSVDRSIVAQKILIIPSTDPKLVLYENHPLEGVKYSQALSSSFSLSEPEVSIRAEPYFFSDIGTLDYGWFLNNEPVTVDRNEWNNITLRQESGSAGVSRVSLDVRGISGIRGRILQNAAAALLIYFGGQGAGAGGFFGQ